MQWLIYWPLKDIAPSSYFRLMASSKPTIAPFPFLYLYVFTVTLHGQSLHVLFPVSTAWNWTLCTYPGKLYWLFMIHYEHQNQMVLLCVSMRVPLQYETVFSLSYNGNVLHLSVRKSRAMFSKLSTSYQKQTLRTGMLQCEELTSCTRVTSDC
jgi:hypothetical protein